MGTSGNIINVRGGDGGATRLIRLGNGISGEGGSSYFSPGGAASLSGAGSAGFFGSGGGGAIAQAGQSGAFGGSGGSGYVIVWEYS